MNKKAEKEELIQLYKDQVVFYKEQIDQLREQNSELRRQLSNLQNGLLAIRAPEAYRDMVADQQPQPTFDVEQQEKFRRNVDIQNSYLRNLEAPLFKTADDMLEMLGKTMAGNGVVATKPIHPNSES